MNYLLLKISILVYKLSNQLYAKENLQLYNIT